MAGIYIHIPFCVSKCRYCDFVSFPCANDVKRRYVDALIKEIKICARELPHREYDTVFIGGGTPSTLELGEIMRIVASLRERLDIKDDAEFTIEANPGTLDRWKLEEYRMCGINRLSLGLQSVSPRILKALGRIHTADDFLSSVQLAKNAGFTNINADLMYGLPEQSTEDFLAAIALAAGSGVEHISAYSLIVEEDTPLYFDINGGGTLLPGEDEAFNMYTQGKQLLESLGFHRYEISNYAKDGYRSKHNLNYWNNGEYLGLGLNSHSAMRIDGKWLRWANKSGLEAYMTDISDDKRPLAEEPKSIERAEEMFECVMLGLRKTEGIKDSEFISRFGESIFEAFSKAIAELDKEELLICTDNGIRLNERGLDIENLALMPFMED
ncbi:MAG: radical SAM family heme chaperone HemW [Eubacteriales bacterium]|nr:radical SAM family heme chaperone HemW [Eubacteriales bacterium]